MAAPGQRGDRASPDPTRGTGSGLAPSYRFPRLLLLRIALAVVRGQTRSLGADSAAGLRGAGLPWRAEAIDHLPSQGPFILVSNHYERPGLWAGWGAMVLNTTVKTHTGRELHWLMASELLDFRLGPWRAPPPLLRRVFARFVRLYGFGLVSARETGLVGGVAGLRVAARLLTAGEPVGIMPEGTASLELREARPGVGEALAWLARQAAAIVPVGVAEREGALTARFGPPLELRPREGDKLERDRALRDQVMAAIGRLLPEPLWGYYRPLLEAERPP